MTPTTDELTTIVANIRNMAQFLRPEMNPDDCLPLIDGSMYAPSHRAIPGVEELWQAGDFDPDHMESLIEGIEDYIDNYDTDGFHIGWDEGTLYMYGPDYTHDDNLTDEEFAEREMGRP